MVYTDALEYYSSVQDACPKAVGFWVEVAFELGGGEPVREVLGEFGGYAEGGFDEAEAFEADAVVPLAVKGAQVGGVVAEMIRYPQEVLGQHFDVLGAGRQGGIGAAGEIGGLRLRG